MAKSGTERAADLAVNANSIAKIIKAAMKGGLKGAAIETLKRYWPQIAAIAGVALMLPVIGFAALTMILYSEEGKKLISEYKAVYEEYVPLRLENLQAESGNYPGYDVLTTGDKMDADWFMAIYCVIHNNNTEEMSDEAVWELLTHTITSEITEGNEETPSVYNIRFLSAEEYMEQNAFTDDQKEWAELLYTEMKNTESEVSSE